MFEMTTDYFNYGKNDKTFVAFISDLPREFEAYGSFLLTNLRTGKSKCFNFSRRLIEREELYGWEYRSENLKAVIFND